MRNPVKLRRKELKRKPAEEKEIYSVGELVVLMNHHSIPWPLRVLNALCLLTGMREGEACGRRWKDLDDECQPLGSLYVHDQYNGLPLKQAEQPRMVPVHPELSRILVAWAQEGFELYTGRRRARRTTSSRRRRNRAKQPNWTRSMFYKAFVKHAEAAGVGPRTLHSTRHTFISIARRGGADKSDLEKVTHNATGDIIDRYTHKDWEPLCAAVLCVRLDVLPELHSPPRKPGDSGGKGPSFLVRSRQNWPQ
jgi:integrase